MAGTPGISDPGEDLVRLCYENGVEVTSLPGACACVTALTLSGLSTRRFCFEAFLPSDKKNYFLSDGRNASKQKRLVDNPESVSAVTQAQAPGREVTSTPFS